MLRRYCLKIGVILNHKFKKHKKDGAYIKRFILKKLWFIIQEIFKRVWGLFLFFFPTNPMHQVFSPKNLIKFPIKSKVDVK